MRRRPAGAMPGEVLGTKWAAISANHLWATTGKHARWATTAPWGVRGLGPRSRHTETAPCSRFPRTGGRHAVEVLSAYLNPAEEVAGLRATLADLVVPNH
jgi:hypothetical protein